MKRIKTIFLAFLALPFMLSAQSLVNNGAVITTKVGSAIKIKGDYVSHQNGRIKNAGPIVLDGDWIEHSTAPVFLPGSTGSVKFTGILPHTITGSYYPVFPNIVLGTEVNLGISTYISQTVDFNIGGGSFVLNSNDLTMIPGSAFLGVGFDEYVVTNGTGRLRMTLNSSASEIIPVSSFNYGSFNNMLVITNNGPTDEFAFRVINDVLDGGVSGSTVPWLGETVQTSWIIHDADGAFANTNYDTRFTWNGAQEGTLFNRNNCSVNRYTGSGWYDYPATGATGTDPYLLDQNGITEFGAFTIRTAPQPSPIHFVIPGGAGNQSGNSWANASSSLQNMMDIATTGQQIWVAAGTYYPETCVPPDIGDRYKSFQPNDSISIYGGFAGNEDPGTFDLSQRDFITNETILSGDVGVIGDSLDNCYHVIYLNLRKELVIDGFTIEHGTSYYLIWWEGFHTFWGPAIYSYYSNFELKNAIVRFNTGERSGSIWADHSIVSISQSSFINNRVPNSNDGGAIKSSNSNLTIDHCDFLNNYAMNSGGCIKFDYGNLSITNCSFNGNYGGYGGGAQIGVSSNLLISGCNFSNNSAYVSGGALDFGYGVTSGLIEDCTFTGNTVNYQGGAINFYHTTINMNRCRFINNNGGGAGGAIYYLGATPITLSNSVISGNTGQTGGGLYLYGSGSFKCSNVMITQNTSIYDGGGVYMQLSPLFFNTIIWNNTAPGGSQVNINLTTSEPQFHYCDIQGGKESFTGTGSGVNYNFDYDNAHNINADPQFTNPAGNDFTFIETSPCINTGVPLGTTGSSFPYIEASGSNWILYHSGGSINLKDIDLALNPRLFDGNIDMGAYEFQQMLQHIVLDLKVFLEGPFNGTSMNTALNGLSMIPLTQPYAAAPWNYPGTESVVSIPNNQVVDWVLLEGRDAPDAASATGATAFAQQAAFLLNNGLIVGLDGSSMPQFTKTLSNQLFIVIMHRNHLGIMSSTFLSPSGNIYSYDFTTGSGQAYGIDSQKNLGGSIFGMYAGDFNADKTINLSDKTNIWNVQAGTNVYLQGDGNLDGQTDNKDKNGSWLYNYGKYSGVPE
jgi:hypothetical protein